MRGVSGIKAMQKFRDKRVFIPILIIVGVTLLIAVFWEVAVRIHYLKE